MNKNYYKGYYMVTNRCNLDCSYCVLEDSLDQLKRELPFAEKIKLIDHLYHKLNFRRLTLSGGEITLIGKNPPNEFLLLLEYLRNFKSSDQNKNLEIEIYTNAAFLDSNVADAMSGIVDQVAITIDSTDENLLKSIGRSRGRYSNYYNKALAACKLLAERGIEIKLHSVISQLNISSLVETLPKIILDLKGYNILPSKWKFYQYMSYDEQLRDKAHAISSSEFALFKNSAIKCLADSKIELHFKDNKEMNDSLFNILSYGTAQFMHKGDTWSTSRRTRDLRTYSDIESLLSENNIEKTIFESFHSIKR
jgi:MoaA/NifB/PqqE/SkfB family radical SAM enzyme